MERNGSAALRGWRVGGSRLLWCMARPSSWSGLWGSVTVQVLQARAQPLPAKPCSAVKREVRPINTQPDCLLCVRTFNSNTNTNCWWSAGSFTVRLNHNVCFLPLNERYSESNPRLRRPSSEIASQKTPLVPAALEFHKYSAFTPHPSLLSSSLRLCLSLKVFVVLLQKFSLHKSKQRRVV